MACQKKAREIMESLQLSFNCQYEEKDSIGKRYRRHDAIGTPYCITVDNQTLEENTVTIRDRDSMKQETVSVDKLHAIIAEKVNIEKYLT
jgi:glycyl-tRNA synthetase